jgi:NAD(P)-dependent dehydrogenase (short-subunit alcohol dehydrogenase family)
MASSAGRLQGKRALVTGAASGIGRATAARFTAEGARVACIDVDRDELDRLVRTLPAALALTADVTDEEQIEVAV